MFITSSSDSGLPFTLESMPRYLSAFRTVKIYETCLSFSRRNASYTVSQVKTNEGHDESFSGDAAVLGETKDETFKHFITNCQSRFPQDRTQVIATRLATVITVVFGKRHLNHC